MQTAERERELFARHIEPDPSGRGPEEARLRESGATVWAVVGYLRAYDGDEGAVRRGFGLSREALDAALRYYRRHRDLIDARLLLNENPSRA